MRSSTQKDCQSTSLWILDKAETGESTAKVYHLNTSTTTMMSCDARTGMVGMLVSNVMPEQNWQE